MLVDMADTVQFVHRPYGRLADQSLTGCNHDVVSTAVAVCEPTSQPGSHSGHQPNELLNLMGRRRKAEGEDISSLVQQGMEIALRRRRPASGLIFHSDRGSQYTSTAFRELLTSHQVRLFQSSSPLLG